MKTKGDQSPLLGSGLRGPVPPTSRAQHTDTVPCKALPLGVWGHVNITALDSSVGRGDQIQKDKKNFVRSKKMSKYQ